MIEIRVPQGLVAFDGRVLEVFYSANSDSKRLHRGLIENIEVQEPKRRRKGKRGTYWLRVNTIMLQFDEPLLPQVQALVAAIKG